MQDFNAYRAARCPVALRRLRRLAAVGLAVSWRYFSILRLVAPRYRQLLHERQRGSHRRRSGHPPGFRAVVDPKLKSGGIRRVVVRRALAREAGDFSAGAAHP